MFKKPTTGTAAAAGEVAEPILLATTHTLPGEYEVLGMVATSTGMKFKLETMKGGLMRAIEEARADLTAQARALGANAIIGINVTPGSNVNPILLVTGTAVRRA